LFVENGHETNYILTANTTNGNTDLLEDESEKHEVQKTGDNKELIQQNLLLILKLVLLKRMDPTNILLIRQKLDDRSDQTKPKEVKVVAEQDVSVEVDESKDEMKEIDE
jgi:hypothetical protein